MKYLEGKEGKRTKGRKKEDKVGGAVEKGRREECWKYREENERMRRQHRGRRKWLDWE